MKKRHAFTLIEMLVVIAIIGIIAALVVNMNGRAQYAKRKAQVDADKNKLTLMIDNYQSKLNFYPPDNTNLANTNVGNYAASYEGWTATNPLLYELTGATIQANGDIVAFDTSTNSSSSFANLFGRSTVANSNPDEPQNFFKPGPQPQEYANYDASGVKGLVVPVTGSTNVPPAINFWHYDASSPNRHNLSSYDLWAEYISGNNNGVVIATNGNWQ